MSEGKTYHPTKQELHEQILCYKCYVQIITACHYLNQGNGEHISHRVVTTTFQFQYRTKIFL